MARYLGWSPMPNKLFAWQNTQGELIAESIYWANGNINMTPRKDGEVGEGWFVVISRLDQIRIAEKNLCLQKKLNRFMYKESVLMKNQIFDVVKI
ncbi:hypothetical protein JMN32_25295 [Fulvivirga sp. 29W222]|uniref:Uncharacterized protein n=1 Tax=Fulvivirga marina TaxID=2494733 RepID=A0A937G746_9BACT|nr:hypothetical protein [Fulvivirga marina]MBL6449651.1 hypothetical protein [Fulvivirga marina]